MQDVLNIGKKSFSESQVAFINHELGYSTCVYCLGVGIVARILSQNGEAMPVCCGFWVEHSLPVGSG